MEVVVVVKPEEPSKRPPVAKHCSYWSPPLDTNLSQFYPLPALKTYCPNNNIKVIHQSPSGSLWISCCFH